jgi:hypothetical protein
MIEVKALTQGRGKHTVVSDVTFRCGARHGHGLP